MGHDRNGLTSTTTQGCRDDLSFVPDLSSSFAMDRPVEGDVAAVEEDPDLGPRREDPVHPRVDQVEGLLKGKTVEVEDLRRRTFRPSVNESHVSCTGSRKRLWSRFNNNNNKNSDPVTLQDCFNAKRIISTYIKISSRYHEVSAINLLIHGT